MFSFRCTSKIQLLHYYQWQSAVYLLGFSSNKIILWFVMYWKVFKRMSSFYHKQFRYHLSTVVLTGRKIEGTTTLVIVREHPPFLSPVSGANWSQNKWILTGMVSDPPPNKMVKKMATSKHTIKLVNFFFLYSCAIF